MKSAQEQLELIRRYIDGTASAADREALQEELRREPSARCRFARYANIDATLGGGGITLREQVLPAVPARKAWFSWRPLTAAAAGIVFGMFCSSVVLGYAAQRTAVKKTLLPVFDPSFEGLKPLDKGLPHNAEQWGVRSARTVSAENGVRPLQGQRMLRMEPILLGEQDENQNSHAYQILDLRSLPFDAVSGTREAQVTASFCAPESTAKARYLIRAVALNEPPATAAENFWSKAEDEEVVSLTQRFETEAGDSDWHTFSVKVPLPHSAQSLVFIVIVTSPKDTTTQAAVRYLDDVQVTLLNAPSDEAHP